MIILLLTTCLIVLGFMTDNVFWPIAAIAMLVLYVLIDYWTQ